MSVARVGIRGGPLLLLIGIAPFLIYRVTSAAAPSWLIGVVAGVQAAALIWLAVRHPAARHWAIWYRVLLVGAAIAAVAAAMLWPGLPARSAGRAIGGICHAVAYAWLLTWFAASLRPDREPVVTELARKLRQTMPATVIGYTRRVTIAWSVFFTAQLAVSAALLITAPAGVWSSFVNLWNLPLVATMMLAEFSCRWFLFRHEQPTGLIETLAGLRRIAGTSGHDR
jgi:uncharacterized membrane protein